MLVVTTDAIDGWQVHRVCGEAIGVCLVRRDEFQGEDALAEARAEAISRMLDQARAKGANVVTGLRFDSVHTGDGTSELCAYGTAVVAIPVTDGARQTAHQLGYGPPR